VAHDGAREYLVAWYGRKKNGEPWEDSWHAEEDVTSDLVAEYESSRSFGVPVSPVTVDVAMVFFLLRKTLSHALMFGAPKSSGFQGRNRPRVHKMLLPLCQLQAIAVGLLNVMERDRRGRVGAPRLQGREQPVAVREGRRRCRLISGNHQDERQVGEPGAHRQPRASLEWNCHEPRHGALPGWVPRVEYLPRAQRAARAARSPARAARRARSALPRA